MTSSLPGNPQPEQFVPFTARLMAAIRAKETTRSDRLFNDPFAAKLAGEEAFAVLEQKLKVEDQAYVVVRTRLFDDFLLSASAKAHQVVILASGMDTRAYRLSWSSVTKIYELDQPQVFTTKATILQEVVPNCQHCAISADLTQPWSHLLLTKGYQPELPSVWLLEGLLMYLSEPEVNQLLQTISQLTATDSYLALDLVNVKGIEYEPYKGYFRSGFDYPEELLAQYDWEAEVIQPGDEGANFDRFIEPLPPRDVPDVARVFLVKAKKQ
ncbi:SAM-dependent methyltransferase [Moorena producens]|uniref:SAM-dependent methyltransferase n=1 Tax=Moorena producens TaxID=1155739 RepID=UPI003C764A81